MSVKVYTPVDSDHICTHELKTEAALEGFKMSAQELAKAISPIVDAIKDVAKLFKRGIDDVVLAYYERFSPKKIGSRRTARLRKKRLKAAYQFFEEYAPWAFHWEAEKKNLCP